MKLQISLLITSIAAFGALHASEDATQPFYGVNAAKNFAFVAFSGAGKQALDDVANQYGIRNAHFDAESKQWTIEVGPSIYKAALGVDTINIADYRKGDGLGFEAQAKALTEGRVYGFYRDGTPVPGRSPISSKALYDKHEKALHDALTRFKAGSGINKASVSRKVKRKF